MRAVRLVTGLFAVLLVAGCGDDDAEGADTEDGQVVVFAATSLESAFEDVEAAFEDSHPGVDVRVTTDGSANLATAILEGAPADVFASADPTNLERVADEGLLEGTGTTFATNGLQIVVQEGNPLDVTGLEDLADPGLSLSLCQPEVPCGRYAAQAFEAAGLPVPPAGEEDAVSGVVTKVSLGEADAGVVYVTDVLAADGVEGIDLPPEVQVLATYPAAVLRDATDPAAATAFVRFLRSEETRAILERHGFGLP